MLLGKRKNLYVQQSAKRVHASSGAASSSVMADKENRQNKSPAAPVIVQDNQSLIKEMKEMEAKMNHWKYDLRARVLQAFIKCVQQNAYYKAEAEKISQLRQEVEEKDQRIYEAEEIADRAGAQIEELRNDMKMLQLQSIEYQQKIDHLQNQLELEKEAAGKCFREAQENATKFIKDFEENHRNLLGKNMEDMRNDLRTMNNLVSEKVVKPVAELSNNISSHFVVKKGDGIQWLVSEELCKGMLTSSQNDSTEFIKRYVTQLFSDYELILPETELNKEKLAEVDAVVAQMFNAKNNFEVFKNAIRRCLTKQRNIMRKKYYDSVRKYGIVGIVKDKEFFFQPGHDGMFIPFEDSTFMKPMKVIKIVDKYGIPGEYFHQDFIVIVEMTFNGEVIKRILPGSGYIEEVKLNNKSKKSH